MERGHLHSSGRVLRGTGVNSFCFCSATVCGPILTSVELIAALIRLACKARPTRLLTGSKHVDRRVFAAFRLQIDILDRLEGLKGLLDSQHSALYDLASLTQSNMVRLIDCCHLLLQARRHLSRESAMVLESSQRPRRRRLSGTSYMALPETTCMPSCLCICPTRRTMPSKSGNNG